MTPRIALLVDSPSHRAHGNAVSRLAPPAEDIQLDGWADDPLAHAWAFVLAWDEEGLAQVLTEAMSVGCPVISTDAQGGDPRFVTDGALSGFLADRMGVSR